MFGTHRSNQYKAQIIMSKLDCVLLIDDDPHSNFFNEWTLKKTQSVEKIVSVHSAHEALMYLSSVGHELNPLPNLIFLDTYMPAMSGWDFLDAFQKEKIPGKEDIIIVMLTTSMNPFDQERAKSYPAIKEYIIKPLQKDTIWGILNQYFAGKLY